MADHEGDLSISGGNNPPPPRVSPFENLECSGEGEEWACPFHQPINLQRSVCQPKQVLSLHMVKLNVVGHALLSSTVIVYLILLLLSLSSELHDILSCIATLPYDLVLMGDCNLHIDSSSSDAH